MPVRTKIPKNKISEKKIEMPERAKKIPPVFDDECPMLSDKELREFKRVSESNRLLRNKQTVTLRLSPQTLTKAKSLGKGYTSVMSRIIEEAFADNETIKKFL